MMEKTPPDAGPLFSSSSSSSTSPPSSSNPIPSSSTPTPSSSTSSSPPLPPRPELIRTAVVFLRNPNVSSASEDRKRLFLKSKSMNDDEVNIALALADEDKYDVTTTSSIVVNDDVDKRLASAAVSASSPLPVSTSNDGLLGFGRSSGVGLTLVIFVGLSYGIYALYVKYVVPFVRRQKRADEKIATLQESVRALEVYSFENRIVIFILVNHHRCYHLQPRSRLPSLLKNCYRDSLFGILRSSPRPFFLLPFCHRYFDCRLQDNVSLTLREMRTSVDKLEASLRGQTNLSTQMEARLKHSQTTLINEVRWFENSMTS